MLGRVAIFRLSAAFFLLAATVPALAEPLACKGQGGVKELPYESSVPSGWDHDRFGTQPRSLMFSYGAFTASFETAAEHKAGSPYTGIPKWVSYEMRGLMGGDGTAIHPQGAKRPVKWYELEETAFLWKDQGLKPGIDTSYRGFATLWNRGHMAARNHANRISWQEGCNTHTFVNALPQFADMNQGDWLALENYAIAAANKFGRVWTIAGPVFEPEREIDTIGKEGTVPVAIPHALFKILVIERKGKVEARAFLFHQADEEERGRYRKCAGTPQSKYDLAAYSTSISALEKATGLSFLAHLPDAVRKAADSGSAGEPWPIEAKYWADRCGGDDDDDDV
ncbi:nuclease [Magnetospirillum sp. ME-1]|uniref:DNA/RNA non-specific endonuclease n=1 Tax=Magnetospirillum sp. ME-1 TaxID=1639348 RepID=UPI000A17D956|nr:DNA/RNA non-specific endonuclease [Magnetospirillum sp. ME-1]ARJ66349.1 nuclease [Magnetospirillum sp. ME-1]